MLMTLPLALDNGYRQTRMITLFHANGAVSMALVKETCSSCYFANSMARESHALMRLMGIASMRST